MGELIPHRRGAAQRIGALIQTSPVAHGTLYLASAVLVLDGAYRLQNRASPYVNELMHMAACPMVIVMTAAYRRLNPNHHNENGLPLHHKGAHLGLGFMLGTSSYLVWMSVMAAGGWATFQGWGWTIYEPKVLTEAIVMSTLGHLAVSLNEEQVFRGYGFETWRQAIGPLGAATILVPLFAMGHRPTDFAGVSGFASLGVMLTGLRMISGSIWLPVGFHWGWNLIQTAVIGHSADLPSLLPIRIDGPSSWTGKTSPETGWVTTILNLVLLMGMLLWKWKQAQRDRRFKQ
jgi:membrane protease YdiL (CAAX protease family)